MEVARYLEILHIFERLKNNTRHSYTSANRKESVAEHSHRLAVMAYFVKDEFPEVDIQKVVLMCLFHDIGEAFTGDIPCFEKTNADEELESQKVSAFLNSLPLPYKTELEKLFEEMERSKLTKQGYIRPWIIWKPSFSTTKRTFPRGFRSNTICS